MKSSEDFVPSRDQRGSFFGRLLFIIFNNSVGVFFCMWVCVCESRCAGKVEGTGSPGAEVTDGYGLSAIVVGDRTLVPERAASAPNC